MQNTGDTWRHFMLMHQAGKLNWSPRNSNWRDEVWVIGEQAILSKQRAETLSSVLYPDDRTFEGKELRLKQQHFFVSATIQDVVRRYKELHTSFDAFPDKVAFQLNDTHPTIGVAELMRLLMDENNLGWTQAWDITQKVRPTTPPHRTPPVCRMSGGIKFYVVFITPQCSKHSYIRLLF